MADRTLYVSGFQQENGSYCGPATAQIIMAYLGKSRTQEYLAGLLGTTLASGTAWYTGSNWPMFDVLNMNGVKSYNVYAYPTNVSSVKSRIVSSINNGTPLAGNFGFNTPQLWNGFYTDGHWFVIRGYKNDGDTIQIVDPYYAYGSSYQSIEISVSDLVNNYICTRGMIG